MLPDESRAVIEEIVDPIFNVADIQVFLKREDLIHDEIPGNKWRKLKYNLEEAKRREHTKILTYGGAFSNHIAAVAAAGKVYGFQTIGIIRGEELNGNNPTLTKASDDGMSLHFVSRSDYRQKNSQEFMADLVDQFGEFYEIPEGGTNHRAVKGCQEILDSCQGFDVICSPVGTGGTIAGLILSAGSGQNVLGFPALKGDFINGELEELLENFGECPQSQWSLMTNYHFGGYAKYTTELIKFINRFKKEHVIQLDPIYTAKMMMGIYDLIKKGYFKQGTKILAIHTGGQQGIQGFNFLNGGLIDFE
ncbi:MAG: pyridoxal-phosphate dependent enzyme [Cyclobacteriaceae bacterium]